MHDNHKPDKDLVATSVQEIFEHYDMVAEVNQKNIQKSTKGADLS